MKIINIGCFLISLIFTSAVYAGSISGKITNTQGNALGNVRVEAFNYSESIGWRNDEITSTDANGIFLFNNLKHEKYRLKFTDRNDSKHYEFYNNTSRFDNTQNIDISNNQNINLQNIVLGDIGTGTISGTVTDTSGTAVPNITVTLSYINTGEYISTVSTATTDHQGKYTFTNIQSNNYKLDLFGSVASNYSQPVNLEAGDILNSINFQVELHGSIKGIVRGIDGEPLNNVEYSFYTSKANKWIRHYQRPHTASDGKYIIDSIPPGKYRLLFKTTDNYEFYNNATTVDNASTIFVFPNQETISNITLGDIEKTGSISGILTDKSTRGAIASATITASIKDYEAPSGNAYWMNISTATTDNEGHYLFANLPPNNYLISAEAIYESNGEPSDNNVIYIQNNQSKYQSDITAGDTITNKNITLSFAHGNIEGKVTDTNNLALANIWVSAYRVSQLVHSHPQSGIERVQTDRNGYFSFENIKNIIIGEYKLKFSNSIDNTHEYAGNTEDFDNARIVTVEPYQSITVNHVFGKEVNSTPEKSTKSGSISQAVLAFLFLLLILRSYKIYYQPFKKRL